MDWKGWVGKCVVWWTEFESLQKKRKEGHIYLNEMGWKGWRGEVWGMRWGRSCILVYIFGGFSGNFQDREWERAHVRSIGLVKGEGEVELG
jgi:hypothetical protein